MKSTRAVDSRVESGEGIELRFKMVHYATNNGPPCYITARPHQNSFKFINFIGTHVQ